jgi:hypothetical protein
MPVQEPLAGVAPTPAAATGQAVIEWRSQTRVHQIAEHESATDLCAGELATPYGKWRLMAVDAPGVLGIPAAYLQSSLRWELPTAPGAQRWALEAGRPAKTFKQWCQDKGIDLPQRRLLPFLYTHTPGDQKAGTRWLLAVAGLGMNQACCQAVGPRYALVWQALS